MHNEIGKSIQQKKRGGESDLFKSMFGVFYKNYSLMINSDSDARLLSKLFTNSKILSDLNKSLLYFNMPSDTSLKENHIPVQLFPPPNSDLKLPSISQILEFFERK